MHKDFPHNLVELFGIINDLEETLFKNLLALKTFNIRVQNLKEIFSKSQTLLKYLNYKYKVNKAIEINKFYFGENKFFLKIDETFRITYYKISLDYILNGFYKIYLYPEKDFCLFKEFPQDKLIEANLIMVELKVNNNLIFSFLNYIL